VTLYISILTTSTLDQNPRSSPFSPCIDTGLLSQVQDQATKQLPYFSSLKHTDMFPNTRSNLPSVRQAHSILFCGAMLGNTKREIRVIHYLIFQTRSKHVTGYIGAHVVRK
jgi:hypothetical protein